MPFFSITGDSMPSAAMNQVADPVMPNQNVSRLLAARGVIAQKVHGLLAKRTGGNIGEDRDTKADGRGGKTVWRPSREEGTA